MNEGIARENQQDDLSIVKARFGLSKSNYNIAGVEVNHPGRCRLRPYLIDFMFHGFPSENCDPGGG